MIMSEQNLTKDENIIYQLETLASYEPDDLDNPEFDVAYELDGGEDTMATVCCIDMATRTLKLITELNKKIDDLEGALSYACESNDIDDEHASNPTK